MEKYVYNKEEAQIKLRKHLETLFESLRQGVGLILVQDEGVNFEYSQTYIMPNKKYLLKLSLEEVQDEE